VFVCVCVCVWWLLVVGVVGGVVSSLYYGAMLCASVFYHNR
jgi:hypothetical protein